MSSKWLASCNGFTTVVLNCERHSLHPGVVDIFAGTLDGSRGGRPKPANMQEAMPTLCCKVQDQTVSAAVGAQVWPLQVLRELDAAEYEEAPPLHAPTSLGDALGGLHGRQRSAGEALPGLSRGKRLSCMTQIWTQDPACACCSN